MATCLIGATGAPIFFIAYELLVGLTPGIGEAMSCGILNSAAGGLSFLVIMLATYFLSKGTKRDSITVMVILAAQLVLGILLLLCVKTT